MDPVRHRRQHLSTEEPVGFRLEITTAIYKNYDAEHGANVSPYDGQTMEVLNILQMAFCVLIGVTSVSLFVFILSKMELRKTPSLWLVMNVIVGTILEALLLLLTVLYRGDGFQVGTMGCHLMYIGSGFTTVHIQISMFILFVDRFICFVQPERHNKIMRLQVVQLLIFCSICIGLAFSITVTYTLLHGYLCSTFAINKHLYLYNVVLAGPPLLLNIMLGLITVGCSLTMCHRLTGDKEQTSVARHTLGLILISVLFDSCLSLPLIIFNLLLNTAMVELDMKTWILFQGLAISFYCIINFILMVLVPEVRSAIGSCCKPEKKDESLPLMRPAT